MTGLWNKLRGKGAESQDGAAALQRRCSPLGPTAPQRRPRSMAG
ncbi:hypothetical protein ACTJKY_07280 [Sphingomonas sp. 22176]